MSALSIELDQDRLSLPAGPWRHRRAGANIEAVGLLHPVVVTPSNELVCGERRIEAARLLGWQEIPVRVVNIEAIVFGEQAENELRKDFTMSERVAIGRAVEESLGERRGRPSEKNRNMLRNIPAARRATSPQRNQDLATPKHTGKPKRSSKRERRSLSRLSTAATYRSAPPPNWRAFRCRNNAR